MKLGSKTHLCDGSRKTGQQMFGRLVNLYVHHEGKWVKVGKMCSNCGGHWVDDDAYLVLRPKTKKTGSSGKLRSDSGS